MLSLGLGPPPSVMTAPGGGAKRKSLKRLETSVLPVDNEGGKEDGVRGRERRRRHSFNLIYDAPEPRQILSR